jgi:phasin family protein
MFDKFETFQKLGKDNVDVAMKSFGAASKGFQAIASEVVDYQKKSFEEGTAALEKLFGAKSLDKAFEAQTEFYKTAYEGFVSKATKIGELYADIAKETYKPIEGAVAKATASVKQ